MDWSTIRKSLWKHTSVDFFPHALTFEKRGEIIAFKQKEDEFLYNT